MCCSRAVKRSSKVAEQSVIELCRRRLPELFAAGLARLEVKARGGDRTAQARLSGLIAGGVPVRLVFEGQGGGELLLLVGREGLAFAQELPAAGFGYALSVPAQAARYGFGLLDRGEIELGELARGVAMFGSHTARDLLGATRFGYAAEVSDVPVLGSLRSMVSLGSPSLPAAPEFTLRVHYDELEDAREQHIAPHQLFLAGKVQIEGNVAKAMLLGMTLAQLAGPPLG